MKRLTIILTAILISSCGSGDQAKVNALEGIECHHCGDQIVFIDGHSSECKSTKNK